MASHSAVSFEHGEEEDDYLQQGSESYATNHRHLQELHRLSAFQQVTTKVPPSYDGIGSWFAYEDAIAISRSWTMTREDQLCETV